MDMGHHEHSSSSSSSGSSSSENKAASWSSTSSPQPAKKRPAGRTKFRETRHPVFRGVRRRGAAGRWVCEVRVPGRRGCRLWLGTYVTAESAARAHDAAMLALGGRSGAPASTSPLNFPDSAWLLPVPRLPAASDLADVRRAAVEAVAEFQRREAASGAAGAVDEVTSGVSELPSLPDISFATAASAGDRVPVKVDEPAAMDGGMFEPDWFGDMDFDTYYASLAQALLLEPPPPPAAWEHGDCGDGGADGALWSY
ncbi:hypothetical protein EJB05_42295, partial [Eragrostis curvula]